MSQGRSSSSSSSSRSSSDTALAVSGAQKKRSVAREKATKRWEGQRLATQFHSSPQYVLKTFILGLRRPSKRPAEAAEVRGDLRAGGKL